MISIHAPRMGSDKVATSKFGTFLRFQSTLPGWGATTKVRAHRAWAMDFNPRSPDGERLVGCGHHYSLLSFQSTLPGWGATRRAQRAWRARFISIHAPRMGSDYVSESDGSWSDAFQSTLPGWGATELCEQQQHRKHHFNPRSPDGERQQTNYYKQPLIRNFNPRSPDGERRRYRAPFYRP